MYSATDELAHILRALWQQLLAVFKKSQALTIFDTLWKRFSSNLAPCWTYFGRFFELLGGLGGIWDALGGSWTHLGRSWSHLGGSWRHLGGSWAALGRVLEANLENLGAILAGLGGQVGGLETNLGASWSQVGRFLGQLGGLGSNLRRFLGLHRTMQIAIEKS